MAGAMHTQPQVSIVDDELLVRQSISRLLQAQGFATCVYQSAREFLAGLKCDARGCVIADLLMPATGGLELQRTLSARGCHLPLVFITASTDIRTAVQAMKGGAVSVLAKPVQPEELIEAVREALLRDSALREALAERHRVQALTQRLTQRERQVLGLMTTGLLNKQIAADLGVSVKTIKVHRSRVMNKMQVTSAAALTRLLTTGGSPSTELHAHTAWTTPTASLGRGRYDDERAHAV